MVHLSFFVARLRGHGRSKAAEIYLRFKGPAEGPEVVFAEQLLSSFCFPLGPEAVQPKEVLASEVRCGSCRGPHFAAGGQAPHGVPAPGRGQEYTFLLTFNDGRRFYGFCRQILPPAPLVGSKLRYPQVLCIISEFPWCNLFFKVRAGAQRPMRRVRRRVRCMRYKNAPFMPLPMHAG